MLTRTVISAQFGLEVIVLLVLPKLELEVSEFTTNTSPFTKFCTFVVDSQTLLAHTP